MGSYSSTQKKKAVQQTAGVRYIAGGKPWHGEPSSNKLQKLPDTSGKRMSLDSLVKSKPESAPVKWQYNASSCGETKARF